MRRRDFLALPLAGPALGQIIRPPFHGVLAPRASGGLPQTGLAAHYDCLQGADAQVLYDRSGSGKHGTLGSAGGADANDPAWLPGVGLEFGEGRYVKLPNISATPGDWTVIAALKTTAAGNSNGQYLLDCAASNKWVVAPSTYSGMKIGYVSSGSWQHDGASIINVPEVVSWVLTPGAAAIWRGTTPVLTGGVYTQAALASYVQLSGYTGTALRCFLGVLYTMLIYNRALAPAELVAAIQGVAGAVRARGVEI